MFSGVINGQAEGDARLMLLLFAAEWENGEHVAVK